MSKLLYSNAEMKQLKDNPNVVKVSERSITFHPDIRNISQLGISLVFIDSNYF